MTRCNFYEPHCKAPDDEEATTLMHRTLTAGYWDSDTVHVMSRCNFYKPHCKVPGDEEATILMHRTVPVVYWDSDTVHVMTRCNFYEPHCKAPDDEEVTTLMQRTVPAFLRLSKNDKIKLVPAAIRDKTANCYVSPATVMQDLCMCGPRMIEYFTSCCRIEISVYVMMKLLCGLSGQKSQPTAAIGDMRPNDSMSSPDVDSHQSSPIDLSLL
ncbi:hypothetical protein J6590_062335 [Homalodisca vitripennis]|nr:hypothetical protein J6590_062335 [Homalodisca vitripennis]